MDNPILKFETVTVNKITVKRINKKTEQVEVLVEYFDSFGNLIGVIEP